LTKYIDIVIGTIGIILLTFFYSFLKTFFTASNLVTNTHAFILPVFVFLLVFLFHKIFSKFSILTHLKYRISIWKGVFLCLAITILINFSYLLFLNGVERLTLLPLNISTFNMLLKQIVVSSYEELIFRGFLFLGLLIRSRRILLSAILSSIAFSAIHYQTYSLTEHWPIHLILLSVGIILCYVYVIFKSLWVPIFLHFANNVIVNLFVFPEPMVGNFSLAELTQSVSMALVCAVFTIYLYRNKETWSVDSFLNPT
jgi:membrane protease YdiL (CAAX protease family)